MAILPMISTGDGAVYIRVLVADVPPKRGNRSSEKSVEKFTIEIEKSQI
jgi:hypothetical protein